MKYLKALSLIAIAVVLGWKAAQAYEATARFHDRSRLLEDVKRRPIRVTDSTIVARPERLFQRDGAACPAAQDDRSQTLVLVFARESILSHEASREWARFVGQRRWTPNQSVWFVADDPSSAIGAPFAAVNGPTVCRLRMTNPKDFVDQTGLRYAPVALLFRGRQLQLMSAGPIGAEQFATFDRYLGKAADEFPTSPFFFDERGDRIIPPQPGVQP